MPPVSVLKKSFGVRSGECSLIAVQRACDSSGFEKVDIGTSGGVCDRDFDSHGGSRKDGSFILELAVDEAENVERELEFEHGNKHTLCVCHSCRFLNVSIS
jgi:hypothetical protein